MIYLKIRLPNGDNIYLDKNISLKEKQKVAASLVHEWRYEIEIGWKENSIKYFLDGLANYIVWHKEEDEKWHEDKEILSITKIEEMIGRRKGKSTPFTSLSLIQKESLFGEKEYTNGS